MPARRPTSNSDHGPRIALETTLLAHGLPRDQARPFAAELAEIARAAGATPALIGLLRGRPVVATTDEDHDALLTGLLDEPVGPAELPKANTANLGLLMHRGRSAATTVSATMELAAAAGIRLFPTGGIGGVHRGYGTRLDISADLAALARVPVAVVASGVKSILDVGATREALESLGVPVIGYRTDTFPAFCVRGSDAGVDARVDDPGELASLVDAELTRTGRGLLICNPIPEPDAIDPRTFDAWLAEAQRRAGDAVGRDATPALLAALREVSDGRTLRANRALVRSNVALAAGLAAAAQQRR